MWVTAVFQNVAAITQTLSIPQETGRGVVSSCFGVVPRPGRPRAVSVVRLSNGVAMCLPVPQVNMGAHRGPYTEDGSLTRGPSPLSSEITAFVFCQGEPSSAAEV